MAEPHEENDKSFMDASAYSLGRAWGNMFKGLADAGMESFEALEVVKAYVMQIAANPREEDPPDA